MQIEFDNKKVESFFIDYSLMQAKIGKEFTRMVKKQLDRVRASNSFAIFLSLGLGKPHPLTGPLKNCYAITVSPNYRLIVEPLAAADSVLVKGVMDYHGGKNEWIIP